MDLTYYILFVVPALILSFAAQIGVKRAYAQTSKLACRRGLTGAQAAEAVLRYYGITNVRIEACAGNLTDHFDPKSGVIRLSEGVFNVCSVAAVGIACHEAGHAAQYAESYLPIRVRNAMLPITRIGSYAGFPLALIGFWLSFEPLITIGLFLYSFIMLFQLATLPVELNASRRALRVIEETGMMTGDDELKGARKVLKSAAMTYVASLAVSFANLLRLVLLFTRRRS